MQCVFDMAGGQHYYPPILCGKQFTVEHSLSCHCGGFPTIRHDKVKRITAHPLSDVCRNIGIEPTLQPVTGEQMLHSTANVEDGAQGYIKAQGF